MMYKFIKLLLVAYFLLIGVVLVGGFTISQKNERKIHAKSPSSSSSLSDSSQTRAPALTWKTYTIADVGTHSSGNDCWLVISGKVYNVTDFIPQHPGGPERITQYCGQDATSAFERKDGRDGHSSTAHYMLASYYIGDLKQ